MIVTPNISLDLVLLCVAGVVLRVGTSYGPRPAIATSVAMGLRRSWFTRMRSCLRLVFALSAGSSDRLEY